MPYLINRRREDGKLETWISTEDLDRHGRYRFFHRSEILVRKAEGRAGPAAPPWLTDKDRQTILNIFREAEMRSNFTGEEFEVDHIVPLKGYDPHNPDGQAVVCGLHVPWNLQTLTKPANQKKGKWFVTGWYSGDEDEVPF
ncbi:HNH endonuclease signature motif containing protein [Acidimangrovimonas sediminis]|uniref:HNH endonuclease signature motif containing protein n=1 Tax=Acidimangrovimonas sediminis TaxID=2056283 RepID=UPI000C8063F4|nr:HNH endonuclease signature motif containing protein [Acidimangrovimonas sediminis]